MHAAKQKFSKGHEMIELPQIQARAEEVAREAATELVAVDIAFEMVTAQFCGQSEETIRVVCEPAIGAVIVEIVETVARVEVDIAVTYSELKLGHEPSGRAVIFSGLSCRLRAGKWSGLGNRRKSKNAARGVHRSCWRRRGSIGDGGDSGCGLGRIIVLLLRKKWKRQKRRHCCRCTPLTHNILHKFVVGLSKHYRVYPNRNCAEGVGAIPSFVLLKREARAYASAARLALFSGRERQTKRQSAVPIAYVRPPRFRKQILAPQPEIRPANVGELVG